MTSRDDDGDPPRDRVDPQAPLPPELNPRGRRAGRREWRAAQAAAAQQAPEQSAAARNAEPAAGGPGRRDLLRGLRLGTGVIAALASIAVLVASGWAWNTWTDFKGNIKRVNAIATAPAQKPKQDIDGKDQNILIVGNDDRDTATDAELAQLGTTRDGGSYNTDTMMLMHVPANGSKATVISFPRDSYVAIPGHGMNKLNSAYPDGINDSNGSKAAGARLLVQTIQNLTGLTIDHFVQVDLLGFYRISNAIGGVQVDLCQAQKEPNSGIDLPAGVSTIQGKQALAFVRQRYGLPNGDLDRIKRQQYFLSAVFRKLSTAGVLLNPLKLQKLLTAVTQSLQMDDSLDPLKLAEQMQNLTAGNLTFTTIPTDGFADTDAGSVVVVNPAQVQGFVRQLINPPASKPPASQGPAPSGITVDVLNGAAATGVAARNAAALQQAGFKIGATGDAPAPVAQTVVEYPAGMQAQARVVAAKVSGATLQQSGSVHTVTLVLGTDGRQVSGASGAAPNSAPSSAPKVTSAASNTGCIN